MDNFLSLETQPAPAHNLNLPLVSPGIFSTAPVLRVTCDSSILTPKPLIKTPSTGTKSPVSRHKTSPTTISRKLMKYVFPDRITLVSRHLSLPDFALIDTYSLCQLCRATATTVISMIVQSAMNSKWQKVTNCALLSRWSSWCLLCAKLDRTMHLCLFHFMFRKSSTAVSVIH